MLYLPSCVPSLNNIRYALAERSARQSSGELLVGAFEIEARHAGRRNIVKVLRTILPGISQRLPLHLMALLSSTKLYKSCLFAAQ